MDVLRELQPYLMAALGFLFGMGGPIIHDRNRRRLDTQEFWQALLHELLELRLRMAFVALNVHIRHATLDLAFLKWIGKLCADHKGASDVTAVDELVQRLPALSDEEMTQTVAAFNARRNPNLRSSFKHYYTPVLTAKIAQLGSLPNRTQIILLEIVAQLAMFNEEVEHTMRFFDMTFENVRAENHEIAIANYDAGSKNIARVAKAIADRISEIPELALD
jgi:hypothetical protein